MAEQLLSGDDVRYLAQQPDSEVGMMLGQMTTLMQNINDLQQDTDDKVAMLENQGWFKRMTNTLFGKNKATKQEIQKNNDKVVTYISQSVAQLYQMNLVNERIICSLGNRMNEIYMQVTSVYQEQLNMKAQISQIMAVQQQTLEAMGAFVSKLNEKIESVDNFHMLISEVQNGMYHDSSRLFNLCSILSQLDKRQMDDSRKMNLLRDTMVRSSVITDEEFTVLRCLQEIIALPTEKVGPIYLELCNFRQSFPANLFADMIENYHFLSKMEKMSKKKETIIQRVMDQYELDPDAAFSIADIADSFIENKQACLVSLASVPRIEAGSQNISASSAVGYESLGEAERLYMNCKYDEAYPELKKLAEQGNGRAIYFMIQYCDGLGRHEANKADCHYWCKKAKENGHPLAMLNYAFHAGLSDAEKTESLRQYAPLVEQLAENGDPISQWEIGVLYQNPFDALPRDDKKGFEWIKKAAEAGCVQAQAKLAALYENGTGVEVDLHEAFKWTKLAAESGAAVSMQRLADVYWFGESSKLGKVAGIEEDEAEAGKWYEKAADAGFPWSMFQMGVFCLSGQGTVSQDSRRGFQYLKKAAELADKYNHRYKSLVHLWLGRCYRDGEGTDQDLQLAKTHLIKAADKEVNAQLELGQLHKYGLNDYAEARKWFQKAADQGNIEAKKELGWLYKNGEGVNQNFSKALQLFEEAAEEGNADAQTALGLMYDNGEGVPQDYEEAAEWYEKAVEQNYAPAMYYLGTSYFYGTGVEEDEDYAYQLLRQAADMGFEPAQDFIDENF